MIVAHVRATRLCIDVTYPIQHISSLVSPYSTPHRSDGTGVDASIREVFIESPRQDLILRSCLTAMTGDSHRSCRMQPGPMTTGGCTAPSQQIRIAWTIVKKCSKLSFSWYAPSPPRYTTPPSSIAPCCLVVRRSVFASPPCPSPPSRQSAMPPP